MSTPLLTTKIRIPTIRSELVRRPRLLARLNTGLHRKLTLLSAPAGFGKTTLLCEWIANGAPPTRVAWLSLDEDDNDVARFWAYVIAALQTACAGLAQETLKMLEGPQRPPTAAILTPLLNAVAALPQSTVLVLDDYHLIAARAIHEGLTFLLEHQPPNLHLALSTRADPPLPTYRLRARGHLTELRSNDLRFTPEEAATFLNQLMGLGLAAEDVNALEARTEGWIAGLQLAALSMQGRDVAATHAFITAFTGGHHYILEYLTEEVLRRQPEPLQRFLIETSILKRLCGPLCDALCDPEASPAERDSAATLADLQRRNLFIVPLDDAHQWYRYHHLFADLLGNLCRRELPEARILELHRRASLWHQAHGTPSEAITHALQARDFERAAALIEQAMQGALSGGSLTTLLRWSEALPEEIVRARPRLQAYQGWALSLNGRPDRAGQVLQDARQALQHLPPDPDNVALRGEIAAMLTGIATLREEPSTIIRESQEALAYLPADGLLSRARVYVALGTAHAYNDDPEEAVRSFRQAQELALQAGNPFLAASAMEMLAGMQIYHQGHLREGAALLGQILVLGTGSDGVLLPFTATAHALLADVYVEWNQLDIASSYLDKGIELLQRGGIGYGVIHTYCAKARLMQALGDGEGALEALQTAEHALDGSALNHMVIHQMSRQVWIRLAQGDVNAAFRWASADPATIRRAMPAELPAHLREVRQMALARVCLARGETDQALAILGPLQAPARAAGRIAHVIEIHLLQALAAQALGDGAAALELLGQSLVLAEAEGYVRLYLDAGRPLIPLLRQAAARGNTYAPTLLAAFGALGEQDAAVTPVHPDAPVLVEPLTQRELEVLGLVCAGYSNDEIAAKLVISINTVKKHTGNIYGKLGVTNRAQAIVETQRLGVLPDQAPGEM